MLPLKQAFAKYAWDMQSSFSPIYIIFSISASFGATSIRCFLLSSWWPRINASYKVPQLRECCSNQCPLLLRVPSHGFLTWKCAVIVDNFSGMPQCHKIDPSIFQGRRILACFLFSILSSFPTAFNKKKKKKRKRRERARHLCCTLESWMVFPTDAE